MTLKKYFKNYGLDSFLDKSFFDAYSFLNSELNLSVKKGILKIYSDNEWDLFTDKNNFNNLSSGLYVPSSGISYVKSSSSVLISDIFHEFFGHGLFFENSSIGNRYFDFINSIFDEHSFWFDSINLNEQFFGICNTNIENYEGFAVWMEDLLCRETGNENIWLKKKSQLPKDYVDLSGYFNEFEKKLTRFGFLKQMGFSIPYSKSDILNTLRNLYVDSFNNIDYVVFYGSKKLTSDIDLFIVSNNPSKNYFNGWLDIYELNRFEFNEKISTLDISVTDPLFSGELIYGSNNSFNNLKKSILESEISSSQINYNYLKSKEQESFLNSFSLSDKRRYDGLSYVKSYFRNSQLLSKGIKPLTLRSIDSFF